MRPYYQKDGITIYCGRAEEICRGWHLHGLFGTIVADPPFSVGQDDYRDRVPFPFRADAIVLLNPAHGYIRMNEDPLQDELVLDGRVAPSRQFGHPAVRPLATMKNLLAVTTGRILDCFMGVSTTLVAARELGREAVGIELEARYCDTAIHRLSWS